MPTGQSSPASYQSSASAWSFNQSHQGGDRGQYSATPSAASRPPIQPYSNAPIYSPSHGPHVNTIPHIQESPSASYQQSSRSTSYHEDSRSTSNSSVPQHLVYPVPMQGGPSPDPFAFSASNVMHPGLVDPTKLPMDPMAMYTNFSNQGLAPGFFNGVNGEGEVSPTPTNATYATLYMGNADQPHQLPHMHETSGQPILNDLAVTYGMVNGPPV